VALKRLQADKATATKEARVKIDADISAARKNILALSANMATLKDHKLKIGTDFKKAKKELKDLTEDQKVVVEAEAETAAARAKITALVRTRVVNLLVRVKSSAAAASLANIAKGISGLNMMQQWSRSFENFFANLPQIALRIAGLTAVIGGLASMAMSALSSIAPLASSLAQIAPLALYAAPAFGALTASVGTLIAVFKGLGSTASPAAKRFNKVLDGVKKQLSKVKTALQEVFFTSGSTQAFERLANGLLPDMESGLKRVASQLGKMGVLISHSLLSELRGGVLAQFFDSLASGMRNARQGIADMVAGLTRIGTAGSEVFPDVGRKISEMGARFKEWTQTADIEGVIRRAAEQAGNLWAALKNAGGVVKGIFSAMSTGESSGLATLAATLGAVREAVESPAFQKAMQTVFAGAAEGAEALREALGPIGESFSELAPTLKNFLSTTGKMAASLLEGIARALATPAAQDGINAALEAFQQLAGQIDWDEVGRLIGSIANALAATAPLIGKILDALLPVLPDIIDAFTELIPPITEVVVALMPSLVEIIKALLPVITALAPVITALAPVVEMLAQVIAAGMKPQLDVLAWVIRDVLAPAIQWMADFMAPTFALIGGILKGDFAGGWEAAKAKVAESAPRIRAAVQGMIDNVLSAVREWVDRFTAWVRELWDGVTRKFSEGVAGAVDWVRGLPGKIAAALGNTALLLVKAGKSIIDGFLDGLKASWKKVTDFVGGIGSWIASHKGPLSYDYRLLQPAAHKIMGGFRDALAADFRDTQKLVAGFAPRLAAATLTLDVSGARNTGDRDAMAGALMGALSQMRVKADFGSVDAITGKVFADLQFEMARS
jgi:phage-related protein/uncharacterized protein YjeT (DUF2065 family)